MSYLSHLSLPTLSPSQTAHHAEENDSEDLFGEFEDDDCENTLADANASLGVVCSANASDAIVPIKDTVGNDKTGRVSVHKRALVSIPSSPQELNGPPTAYNQLLQNYETVNTSTFTSTVGDTALNYQSQANELETYNFYNFQTNINENAFPGGSYYESNPMDVKYNQLPQDNQTVNTSTFTATAGDTTLNYQSQANESETHNFYNFQTNINENTFPGGYYQPNPTEVQTMSAPRTHGLLGHEYIFEHYPTQNNDGALGDDDGLQQLPYAQQRSYYQAPQASDPVSNEHVQYDDNIALPSTPTPSQTPTNDAPASKKTHRTRAKKQKVLQQEIQLPIAPASVTSAHVDVITDMHLGTQVLDGKFVYFDQFNNQMQEVPSVTTFKIPSNAPIDGEETASQLRFNNNVPYYPDFHPGFLKMVAEGGLMSALKSDQNIVIGASEISFGDIHHKTPSELPPVIPTGTHTLPSTSSHVLPSRFKRPREDDVVTLPETNMILSRKRHNAETIPAVVQDRSFEEWRLIPPFTVLGPHEYVCNYSGPIIPNAHRICGTFLMSGARNRDRHLSSHAAEEERAVNGGIIRKEDAHALLWVKKIIVDCDVEGCDFRTAVWRTDNVRKKHIAQAHPELKRQKENG